MRTPNEHLAGHSRAAPGATMSSRWTLPGQSPALSIVEREPTRRIGAPYSRGDVLETKLRPPVTPPTWTVRNRLDLLLSDAVRHRLTVVTGPPGAGKTVMLAGWAARHSDRRVAWVSLEATDDDPQRFWQTLAGALRPFGHRSARFTPPLPDSLGPHGVGYVVEYASDLPAVVLVLDDFHAVNDASIVADVGYLVRNLPPQLRVVLSSREDPDLPLHRLRLRGELAEIREHDLRFETAEAAQFVESVTGRELEAADLELLVERTEGWAAGLQLAALSLREEPDPSAFVRRFAGSSHLVAEYLIEEVLAVLPEDVIRFLLLTSVLDRMTESLCEYLTGASDAREILDDLVGRHLFVVRMDSEHRWYRYHRLFADLLRHSLRVRDPTAVRVAHERAAEWFEMMGDRRSAAAHLVAAGALDRAFAIGAGHAVDQLEAGFALDERAVLPAGLPDAFFVDDPLHTYGLVLGLLAGLHAGEAELWLRRLPRIMRRPAAWLAARVELAWVLHDWMVGDAQGMLAHHAAALRPVPSHTALPPLPEDVRAEHPWLERLDHLAGALLGIMAARAHNWLGHHNAARAAVESLVDGPDWVASVSVPGVMAVAATSEGRLVAGQQLATHSLGVARRIGIEHKPSVIDAHLALGAIHRERDELDQADRHVNEALQLCRRGTGLAWLAAAELEWAALLMAQGRLGDSYAVVSRLRACESDGRLPARIQVQIGPADVRWHLAAGDLDGALRLLDTIPEHPSLIHLRTRADLRGGRVERAVARLGTSESRSGSARDELERLTLLSEAASQLGDRRRARETLRLALDKGRPEGWVRPFLDGGRAMSGLLQSLETWFADPYLELLRERSRPTREGAPTAASAPLARLTSRESAALTRLPTYLTQRQIADELYISLNTLKTHLKSLYRKLGASSRAEAVVSARAHGLI
jgi:LuxR family transcriptional regulator, maltose regulon positive regulatory protein